ncbi:MAG: hypothetical protein LW878_02435 [Proteobacteria bacterium]|jgi:hypothetical protein|nr:hypothetical protein [Pseudomonadota bacterium]
MEWSKKIDNRKYAIGTFFALVIIAYVTRGRFPDVIYLLVVTLGSALNQWLMFVILGKIFKQIAENKKFSLYQKFLFWLQVALKFFLLGSIFYALIVHARHVVAQGLILYTFQLIILILSIKNIADSMKKGSGK